MSVGEAKAGKAANTLVLFADGTGNSSAKLFKTNVYRMYEAVDLGFGPADEPVQIAYYDNGVGTQRIVALAWLAGIFGFGLKANILRLYRFACRNGSAESQFYFFGFSRGAFTIRLVVSMIAKYGLVRYSSEAELNAKTLETFREFMRGNNPNVAKFVGIFGRAIRDSLVWLKRQVLRIDRFGPTEYVHPRLRFVGVWDTVAAYGGPFAEVTRGIDDYLWPLSMTDSCLNARVEVARHALSVDDERDAFLPVLWDEVDWDRKAQAASGDAAAQQAFRNRLKQVWFAGMHSDVGGGYPDPSLSFVSLVWMMREAENAGLRLLTHAKDRYNEQSNSLGPIHDSRGGLGVYYRPQPRKIAAFLHPASGMDLEGETLGLRDPVLGELPKPPHGVLLGCRVHESVIARIVEGTDDYAPIILPPQFSIEPYSSNLTGGVRVVDPALFARLGHPDPNWYRHQERIWDKVFWRRLVYFGAVISLILLILSPLWAGRLQAAPEVQDFMRRILSWRHQLPLGYGHAWVRVADGSIFAFSALLALAIGLSALGSRLKAKAQSRSFMLWRERIAGGGYSLPAPGWLTRFRNSRIFQGTLQFVKWRALPAVAAASLFLAAIWAGYAIAVQVAWTIREPGLCQPGDRDIRQATEIGTWQQCVHIGQVTRGHRYRVEIEVTRPWRDGTVPADPIGVRSNLWQSDGSGRSVPRRDEEPSAATQAAMALGVPLRRVTDARYLQAGLRIHGSRDIDGARPRVITRMLHPISRDRRTFTDIVLARTDGDLFFFVNDAGKVWGDRYDNNCGTAVVRVRDLDAAAEIEQRAFTPIVNLGRCEAERPR